MTSIALLIPLVLFGLALKRIGSYLDLKAEREQELYYMKKEELKIMGEMLEELKEIKDNTRVFPMDSKSSL